MDEPQFVELTDGVHAMISPDFMSNCTLVLSGEELLVVDAPATRRLAEAVVADACRLTSQPIRWVVSSHFHPDHTLHLSAYVPPARVPLERALAEIRLDAYVAWPKPERMAQVVERAYAELT